MAVPVSVNIKNIGSVSLPIALVALAGWLAFLAVVYKDDWARNFAMAAVVGAVLLYVFRDVL